MLNKILSFLNSEKKEKKINIKEYNFREDICDLYAKQKEYFELTRKRNIIFNTKFGKRTLYVNNFGTYFVTYLDDKEELLFEIILYKETEIEYFTQIENNISFNDAVLAIQEFSEIYDKKLEKLRELKKSCKKQVMEYFEEDALDVIYPQQEE